jgi:hypothetical protein
MIMQKKIRGPQFLRNRRYGDEIQNEDLPFVGATTDGYYGTVGYDFKVHTVAFRRKAWFSSMINTFTWCREILTQRRLVRSGYRKSNKSEREM